MTIAIIPNVDEYHNLDVKAAFRTDIIGDSHLELYPNYCDPDAQPNRTAVIKIAVLDGSPSVETLASDPIVGAMADFCIEVFLQRLNREAILASGAMISLYMAKAVPTANITNQSLTITYMDDCNDGYEPLCAGDPDEYSCAVFYPDRMELAFSSMSSAAWQQAHGTDLPVIKVMPLLNRDALNGLVNDEPICSFLRAIAMIYQEDEKHFLFTTHQCNYINRALSGYMRKVEFESLA